MGGTTAIRNVPALPSPGSHLHQQPPVSSFVLPVCIRTAGAEPEPRTSNTAPDAHATPALPSAARA